MQATLTDGNDEEEDNVNKDFTKSDAALHVDILDILGVLRAPDS
jgi:hypothetical protein